MPVSISWKSLELSTIHDHSGDIIIKNISEKDFDRIAKGTAVDFKERSLPNLYFYDAEISTIIVHTNAPSIHESTVPFFQYVVVTSNSHLQGIIPSCTGSVTLGNSSKFDLYRLPYMDDLDSDGLVWHFGFTWMKSKFPDLSVEVTIDGVKQSPYLTIVMELGYGETH